jgi:hypothetical protein
MTAMTGLFLLQAATLAGIVGLYVRPPRWDFISAGADIAFPQPAKAEARPTAKAKKAAKKPAAKKKG